MVLVLPQGAGQCPQVVVGVPHHSNHHQGTSHLKDKEHFATYQHNKEEAGSCLHCCPPVSSLVARKGMCERLWCVTCDLYTYCGGLTVGPVA